MLGSIGDVASSCGPNPCGVFNFLGSECATWQTCAAAANQTSAPLGGGPCVVGGLDENGNTIVSCGGAPPCLTGPGPLQPGQDYCPGVLGQGSADQNANNPVGVPQWLLLAGVVFGLALIAGRS